MTHLLVRPANIYHAYLLYSGTLASVLTHMYPASTFLLFIDIGIAGTWGLYTSLYMDATYVNLIVFLFYWLVESYPKLSMKYTIGHTIFHLLSAVKEYYIVAKNEVVVRRGEPVPHVHWTSYDIP